MDMQKYNELKMRMARLADLGAATGLMAWDQQVFMPPGAAETRARQMATIGGMLHEMGIDPALGTLLEALNGQIGDLDYDSDEASIVRVNWRDYQKAVRIPPEKVAAFFGAVGIARPAWAEARAKSDFSLFQPHLERLVDMQIELAELIGYESGNPYDALLDFYETGLTYELISGVFSAVKPQLVELIHAISQARQVDDGVLHGSFPQDEQLALGRTVAGALGYSFNHGRLDLSVHPFTSASSHADVRITTRIDETFWASSLMSVIHEAGHGIHAQRLDPNLYGSGVSAPGLSVGESQSRFYENVLGRSRAFCAWLLPRAQEAFRGRLDGVSVETLYRALNRVQPSLIRVEADEVTYGMHIMLRFELENAVINGQVKVADLPQEWDARMEQYLGVVPPDDAQGVLQDIHWSQSPMGYFPTYLLGSMFAAQLWDTMQVERPGTRAEIEAGQFEGITAWLTDKIHRHGGKFTFPEIAERATGHPPTSEPYIAYLRAKYGEVYGL
jgi:carboxypeptidase Taq